MVESSTMENALPRIPFPQSLGKDPSEFGVLWQHYGSWGTFTLALSACVLIHHVYSPVTAAAVVVGLTAQTGAGIAMLVMSVWRRPQASRRGLAAIACSVVLCLIYSTLRLSEFGNYGFGTTPLSAPLILVGLILASIVWRRTRVGGGGAAIAWSGHFWLLWLNLMVRVAGSDGSWSLWGGFARE